MKNKLKKSEKKSECCVPLSYIFGRKIHSHDCSAFQGFPLLKIMNTEIKENRLVPPFDPCVCSHDREKHYTYRGYPSNQINKCTFEIIDWERKGNLIRFYIGVNGNQRGDDWDDAPYEHNAGRVYEEYIMGEHDIVVPFNQDVFEPCAGYFNSPYCKEDMIKRKVPCIVIAPEESNYDTFEQALADEKSVKYYFGDRLFLY